MSVGKNIKHLRESHRMTQLELAEIAGVSDRAISAYENETRMPKMGAVSRMAKYFQVPLSEIIDDTESTDQELFEFMKSLTPENQEKVKDYMYLLVNVKRK